MTFVVRKMHIFAAIYFSIWVQKLFSAGIYFCVKISRVKEVFEQKCWKSKHLVSAKKEQCFASEWCGCGWWRFPFATFIWHYFVEFLIGQIFSKKNLRQNLFLHPRLIRTIKEISLWDLSFGTLICNFYSVDLFCITTNSQNLQRLILAKIIPLMYKYLYT